MLSIKEEDKTSADGSKLVPSVNIKQEPISNAEDAVSIINPDDFSEKSLKISSNGPFVCGICQQGFSLITDLHSHFSETPIKTDDCKVSAEHLSDNKILNKPALQSIVQSENNTEIFDDISVEIECNDCGMIFSSYDSLEVHSKIHIPLLEEQLGLTPVHCEEYPLKVKEESDLESDSKAHIPVPNGQLHSIEVRCDECPLKFEQKSDLDLHKISHKQDEKLAIRDSTLVTSRSSVENTGVKITYRCESCSSLFKDKYRLTHHKKKYHQRKKSTESLFTLLKNSLTERVIWSNKTGLNPIQNKDKSADKFVCNICSISFRYSSALSLHKSTHHDGIHKFILPKQPKSAPILAPRLTRLSKKVGGRKLASCELTDEKNFFKCENCEAIFWNEKNFNFHRKLELCSKREPKTQSGQTIASALPDLSHINSRPSKTKSQNKTVFACTFCSKVFSYAHNLSYHTRIHDIK